MKSKSTSELARNLLHTSTVHGFRYINSKFRARQLIWLLLVLASTGIMFQKVHEVAVKYFQYPFTTTITSEEYNYEPFQNRLFPSTSNNKVKKEGENTQSFEFPAITICNLNSLTTSKMNGTKFHRILLKSKENDTYRYLDEYINDLKETKIVNVSHTIQDMLVDCKDDGWSSCDAQDFKPFYHQEKNMKCFTYTWSRFFGSDIPTDSSSGLRMTIDVEHDDYYKAVYPKQEAGIRLIVHDKDEVPFRHQGVRLSPGFTTYVSLKETKVCFKMDRQDF